MDDEWQPTNDLWSEQYRLMGEEWADAEAAASLLEDSKSSILSQRMAVLGDIPVNRAELIIKSSPDWEKHLTRINEARRKANILKIRMDYLKMKYHEHQGAEATKRTEMRIVV